MARASAKALNREYWRLFGRRKSNAKLRDAGESGVEST